MLASIEIRNIVIIEHLKLELRPGLNVLSGETGAGKSILLDALGFVLGWRGPANLVRRGAPQGEVEAVFNLRENHPAHTLLDDAGIESAGELVLRRINTKGGRKMAWANDRRCSGEFLRLLGSHLVELHGQHDDRGLLNIKTHRGFLDAFMDPKGALRGAVKSEFQALKKAEQALKAAEEKCARLKKQEEFLRFAFDEIEKLAPEAGEDKKLDTARRLMQAGERIQSDVLKAYQLLSGESFESILYRASRHLSDMREKAEGRLDGALDALGRAESEISEAMRGIEACLNALEFDPEALEQTEERLFAIRALARKHNITSDEFGAFADDLRQKIQAIDAGDKNLSALRLELDHARAAFQKTAHKLRKARYAASHKLDKAMRNELAPLKMERARFQTEITDSAPSTTGIDTVLFKVATNPGTALGAINKIASGGELSRFMLALKLCLSKGENSTTMIFDEIDTGIGGATADAVGRRLRLLGQEGQILVVTHSPQIAARANHHWRINKTTTAGESKTDTEELCWAGREKEIARMLAGTVVSKEALKAAQALLSDSGLVLR